MKKLRIATLGILALLLILPASLKAELLYETYGNTITITGSNPKASGILVIPSTVTSIGGGAFYGCTGLTSVTITDGVTSIGGEAFLGCSGLTSFSVDTANTTFSSKDGVLFNKAQTSLLNYPAAKTRDYTIPNSVTSISEEAFWGCYGLTSVSIPNSVTSIGEGAFSGCSGLTSVTLPSSITSIGKYAFEECTGLTSVTLPSSLTSIGDGAFLECTGLTSVYFLGNAPGYRDELFENSFNVTVYHSPDSAGWGATFGGRPTALWFADGLLGSIKGNAITITGRATKPTGDLIIPSTINGLPVTSIGADAFYGSYELTSITLPSSLTSIGEAAFYGCSGLTSITIPSGVTFMGSESFMWCDALTGVYFLGNAPAKGYGVFGGVLGATVYYVNGKSGWGATFAGRPTAKWVPVEPPVPPVPTVNTLVVQVSPFIQNPSWASVATNRFPNSGVKQFYRMRASVVEVTLDLKNSAWTPVATNNIPDSGSQLFYRLVAQ